jgi:hypothetical protein
MTQQRHPADVAQVGAHQIGAGGGIGSRTGGTGNGSGGTDRSNSDDHGRVRELL